MDKPTEFAVKMSQCQTIVDLKAVWCEITGIRGELGEEWFNWLKDMKDANKIRLQPEETPTWLTKEGQEKWTN